jgi:hypothetical protein
MTTLKNIISKRTGVSESTSHSNPSNERKILKQSLWFN